MGAINNEKTDMDGIPEAVEGLASYRALKEASEGSEGIMDGEYIQKLVTSYDNSFEKECLAEHRGYVVLVFMVSLALFVTILLRNILSGGAFMAIFMVMLMIFNQIYVYPVNHWFANFMPVRMTDFWHFYTGYELYRICGVSVSCMSWSIVVSLMISVIFLAGGLIVLSINRKRGLNI